MAYGIFLPELKHIKIENYSLYNKNIEYDFIDGINLIIGGNGVGKTTFINIIKYALIGLYKKDLIVRNYQGEKRLSRGTYNNCNTYFRNRTQNISTDQDAVVILYFKLNGCEFEVTRSLFNTMILSANYTENNHVFQIKGEQIRQDQYAKYENDSEEVKKKYLQYNYEQIIAEKANMTDFNDFIFFVNQILLFGEDRSNVLWDVDTQSRLLSNYLNDKKLEKERKDCQGEKKYQDSIARHKQEEIKAVRKVLDQLSKNKNDKNGNNEKQITDLMVLIEENESYLLSVDDKYRMIHEKGQSISKNIADLSIEINELEKEKNKIESETSIFWPGINPQYTTFKRQMESNHICPMCNSQIDINIMDVKDGECFFCHKKIKKIDNEQITLIENNLKILLSKRQNYEIQLLNYEKEINELDREARTRRIKLFELKNKLRDIESITTSGMEEETAYIAMIDRINELSAEKEEAQKKCEILRKQELEIMQLIESNLVESTRSISDIFKQFAEAFLQLPCYLSLVTDENSKLKVFRPVIDKKARVDAEELSESQRFFIDYSFRMSILSYFYNGASFYICETPDSSLDLSYEENAANTLLKYIERPNSLIITSNLNNSVFIKHLLGKTKKVSILNLLRYGKVSQVQTNHRALQALSKEIEEIVNEKL